MYFLISLTLSFFTNPTLFAKDFSKYTKISKDLACNRLLIQHREIIQADINSLKEKQKTMQTALNEDQTQLSAPEELRKKKDPRWFASLRDPKKNPVTLNLKEMINYRQELIKNLSEKIAEQEITLERLTSPFNEPNLSPSIKQVKILTQESDLTLIKELVFISLKHNLSLNDTASIFKMVQKDSRTSNQAVLLILTELEAHQKEVKEVSAVKTYLELQKIINNTSIKKLSDSSICLLTEIALETKTSATIIKETLNVFEESKKITSEAAKILLTKVALRFPNISKEELILKTEEIYNSQSEEIGETKSLLSATILTLASYELSKSIADVLLFNRELSNLLLKENLRLSSKEKARLTWLGIHFNLSTQETFDLFNTVFNNLKVKNETKAFHVLAQILTSQEKVTGDTVEETQNSISFTLSAIDLMIEKNKPTKKSTSTVSENNSSTASRNYASNSSSSDDFLTLLVLNQLTETLHSSNHDSSVNYDSSPEHHQSHSTHHDSTQSHSDHSSSSHSSHSDHSSHSNYDSGSHSSYDSGSHSSYDSGSHSSFDSGGFHSD